MDDIRLKEAPQFLHQALKCEECPFARKGVRLVLDASLQGVQNAVASQGSDAETLHHPRNTEPSSSPVKQDQL